MIFATDLDRTIIHSKKFLNINKPTRCIEKKEDMEISYMTNDAIELLDYIKKSKTIMVPITTRSLEQFKRISIFQDLKYAITSNGGTILVNGKRLLEWDSKINKIKQKKVNEYSNVFKNLNKYSNFFKRKITLVDDMFFFTKLSDDKDEQEKVLSLLNNEFKDSDWEFTLQGIKLYIMPKEISKENALKFLKEYLNENYIITSGDGKLDKNFILLGNEKLIPANSEVLNYMDNKQKYKIVSEGMLGTEEIFKYVLSRAE